MKPGLKPERLVGRLLKLYMGLRVIDNSDGTYGIYDKYGRRIAGEGYLFSEVLPGTAAVTP